MKSGLSAYFLLLAILLQSFTAVAESRVGHVPEPDHLQTIHEHAKHDDALFATASADDHDMSDCHHCGHCQGSHSAWQACVKAALLLPALRSSDSYFHQIDKINRPIESLIRPPIAHGGLI